MRILVGNNTLNRPGGSETYTYALVEELVRRNHDVICVSPNVGGLVTEKIKALGVDIFKEPVQGSFDLLLMSHSSSIKLTYQCKGFKIQTCHRIYVPLEQPVVGMDAYVAISEEVELHLLEKNVRSTIIRNGVNCNRFYPKRDINSELKTILSLSHSDGVNRFLAEICSELGYELIVKNKYRAPVWAVEDYIDRADLVVSIGRGCYESMAAGRNVFIYDNRDYSKQGSVGDGFITPDNAGTFLKNNCSGRFSKKEFTKEAFIEELGKYNKENGAALREFALENLNIEKQVDKYLALVR